MLATIVVQPTHFILFGGFSTPDFHSLGMLPVTRFAFVRGVGSAVTRRGGSCNLPAIGESPEVDLGIDYKGA
jgi:hypothetical protein